MAKTQKTTKKVSTKEAGRVRVHFGVLGESLRTLSIKEGTTLGTLSKKYGLSGLTIKVNGVNVKDMNHVIANNSEVIAVPQAKNG